VKKRISRFAVVLVVAAAVGAASALCAGCGVARIGRVSGPATRPAERSAGVTEPAPSLLDPDRGPLFADPTPAPAPRFREWKVPPSWKLYDACDRWAVFLDLSREFGQEPLVLMDARTGRLNTLLVRAQGASAGLAITAAQVSRGWVVWEESSVHDIELGRRARWRILAAPLSAGGSLGRVRVVDEGVAGTRPRCTFRLVDASVVVGMTEVRPARAALSPARDRVLRTAGSLPASEPAGPGPSEVTGRAAVFDLVRGGRRTVARFAGASLAVAWARGRVLVVRQRAGSAQPTVVSVYDDASGREIGSFQTPAGTTALRRPSVSVGRVAFACGGESGDETLARTCVTSADGRMIRRSVFGAQDPVLVGRGVVYRLMSREPAGRGPLRGRLVWGDPATGRQVAVTPPVPTELGVWIPVIGAGYDPRHYWTYFRSQGGGPSGAETPTIVRCYDMP
jgi:hypothetical protein